ncbi:MAG TPA: S8 family serine peptidase [Gaiellaceae bacterium]|nr:S8 family serine peptidase [Gaiellaceae bacterium]
MRHLKRLLAIGLAAATAAVVLSGDGFGRSATPMTEVVVTLQAPPLSFFGRSLLSVRHASYLQRIEAQQAHVARRIETSIAGSSVRWRYRLVLDGLAVVLPRASVRALSGVAGVSEVWPSVRYHALTSGLGPQQIGADKLWSLGSAGNGMKIGIIDDGLDASHPYFDPSGFQYPPGYPKGLTAYTTPKVIVQRTFAPPGETWKYANVPFDPTASFHATHVAGIAAGDHGTLAAGVAISGVAPNAYLGNYKALTVPTPDFGLDGNSPEIAAAIEAAVADGMNVINLSLGEPEVEPSRDLVVQAIDGAAAAGVVPVVAAGNDFSDFGYGSISSPGSAPDAITVGAVDSKDVLADFSSAGPTPVSLEQKPDVVAPGVDVLSALPPSDGTWGRLGGTSMATPHVAGAAALLLERHPTWSVAELKSALVQTADAAFLGGGSEAPVTREGGGLVDLPRADAPLLFAAPSGLSFGELAPGAAATREVALSDAGGGAGTWSATVKTQEGAGAVTVPPAVSVPGVLAVTATGGATAGDAAGFVVLTRGTDVRRIPFWFLTSAPRLATERKVALARPGVYGGTTVGAPALVTRYRYPTGVGTYPGGERVFRFRLPAHVANAGVVVLSGAVVPHVTFDGSEDRLAGYAGLPEDLNPYRRSYGDRRRVAGVVLPRAGAYDAVFDAVGRPGPFTFRYWVNDVSPPRLQLLTVRGAIAVSAVDAGSGVDPASIAASLDGKPVAARYAGGIIRIRAAPGAHRLVLSVADYQETKNMEDVPRILPNTARLRTTVRVR